MEEAKETYWITLCKTGSPTPALGSQTKKISEVRLPFTIKIYI